MTFSQHTWPKRSIERFADATGKVNLFDRKRDKVRMAAHYAYDVLKSDQQQVDDDRHQAGQQALFPRRAALVNFAFGSWFHRHSVCR